MYLMYFIYKLCFFLKLKSFYWSLAASVMVKDFKPPQMAKLIYYERLPVFFFFLKKKCYYDIITKAIMTQISYYCNPVRTGGGFLISSILFSITPELLVIITWKVDCDYMEKSYFCKKLCPLYACVTSLIFSYITLEMLDVKFKV